MRLAAIAGCVGIASCTEPEEPADAAALALDTPSVEAPDSWVSQPDTHLAGDASREADAAGSDLDSSVGRSDAGARGELMGGGRLGTHGGPVAVSGPLAIVDDGFELSGMSCNGALCVYGGWR